MQINFAQYFLFKKDTFLLDNKITS